MSIFLIVLGVVVIYLSAVIRYVKPPFEWVIEMNFPGMETKKKIWKGGLHFLWIPIPPFMYVRNKLYCGDDKTLLTIGVSDENPGNPSLVEFMDTSASVIAQVILKVVDPIKATYEIEDHRSAALERIEGTFRKILSGMTLDDAMSNVDARSKVSKDAFKEVSESISRWGVELANENEEIPIIDFILQKSTLEDRAKILTAEKDAVARVRTAEAAKTEAVLLGEGEGMGEAQRVNLVAKTLRFNRAQAADYVLKRGMLEAIKGSTIIATSEGGKLNTPIGLAQTLFAVDNVRTGKEGSQQ